ETEQIPALAHMGRKRRGHVYLSAVGMRNDDPASMQMQAVLEAAREFPVGVGLEIFGIADDGIAQIRRMNPKLVGSSGVRLHLEPCEALAGLLDHAIIGNRVVRAVLAMPRHPHAIA